MPIALVTNDDGIDSQFLWSLVDALMPHFEVRVAAPAEQQSWVGRKMSRTGEVPVIEKPQYPVPTWSIGGTPSDCVNIALGHLLPEPPAVVVSGINIGFNVTLPLVLSSGTVAAAVEGALWGLPAVATSMHLPPSEFEGISEAHGNVSGAVRIALDAFAAHTAAIVRLAVAEGQPGSVVHNLNGPIGCAAETPMETTRLELRRMPSLFARDAQGTCRFTFNPPASVDDRHDTDARCVLERRHISHTRVDFAALTA